MGLFTGAEIVIKALKENGVDTIFGYPGGAVLPIYDEIFKQNDITHILVRHEQAAVHAAEGYARSTGKVGCVLVTSGPGATNTITGLMDALLDSVPIVCLTGQVPSHLIGSDAFQEADTSGITRHCTKSNYLVKDVNKLAKTIHESFYIASVGRPGPVVVDIPKDIQFNEGEYYPIENYKHEHYYPQLNACNKSIDEAVELLLNAKKPIIYGGGGLINAFAGKEFTKLVEMLKYPTALTLMGLGALDADNENYLGMVGMHGTVEANHAMHDCDLMFCVGARFDDRVTGLVSKFSPNSKKIHMDIEESNINKIIKVDVSLVGDCKNIINAIIEKIESRINEIDNDALKKWWDCINENRATNCLDYDQQDVGEIKPQHAIKRFYEIAKKMGKDTYITTEVGQHQMWAAQYFKHHKPNRWMTSGGLGTMGYGFPAAVGVQIANPDKLVGCIAGEASILMNIQELSTCSQYKLPVKLFIVNNQWMGMVRQWQELLHGGRYSNSYTDSLPDFVKLAEAYNFKGIVVECVSELDNAIVEMIEHDGPVIFDVRVKRDENCYPMIPSGAAHNEMILGELSEDSVSDDGKKLV